MAATRRHFFRTKKPELGRVRHGSKRLRSLATLQRKEEPELVKPKKNDFIDYIVDFERRDKNSYLLPSI